MIHATTLGISWNPMTGKDFPLHWRGRYQNALLLFPLSFSSLNLLDGSDILSHFYGPEEMWPIWSDSNSLFETDSAILILGLRDTSPILSSILNGSHSLSFVGKYFGGKHFGEPTISDAIAKGKEIVSNLCKRDAAHIFQFSHSLVHFQKNSVTWWWYGRAEIKRVILPKYSRLYSFDDTNWVKGIERPEGRSNPLIASTPYFELILGILCSLSFEKRLKYVTPMDLALPFPPFQLLNQQNVKVEDLVMFTIYSELKVEIGTNQTIPMKRFAQFVDWVISQRDTLSVREKMVSSDALDTRDHLTILILALMAKLDETFTLLFRPSEMKKEFNYSRSEIEKALFPNGENTPWAKHLRDESSRRKKVLFSIDDFSSLHRVMCDDVPPTHPNIQDRMFFPSKLIGVTNELFDVLDQWEADARSSQCHLCRVEFGVLNRKHHCRKCKKIFCQNCSNRKSLLPGSPELGLVRFCVTCYQNQSGVTPTQGSASGCVCCGSKFSVMTKKTHCALCDRHFCSDCRSPKPLFLPHRGRLEDVCRECFHDKLGVTWIEMKAECAKCSNAFGVKTRRHHCRMCGNEFCDACCRHRLYLRNPYLRGRVRVCDECFPAALLEIPDRSHFPSLEITYKL